MGSSPRPGELGSIESRVARQPFEALIALLDWLARRIAEHYVELAPRPLELPDKQLTAKEAAEYIRTDTDTLYRLAKAGEIPHKPPSEEWKTYRFSARALDEWASQQIEPAKPRRRRAA